MASLNAELAGRLYVVATPIGNDADMSPRALEVLSSAAFVAAEDTRYAKGLLSRHGIRARVISCNAHNQARRVAGIMEELRKGGDVALVTDSGTPGISDPGGEVVAAVAAAGFRVVPVPGPCAAVAAVSISGMAGKGFVFAGFLPRARARRRRELKECARLGKPVVVYESPRRVRGLLEDLVEVLEDPVVVSARELTKSHEEILRGRASQVLADLAEDPKGEFVIVVGANGPGPNDIGQDEIESAVSEALSSGASASAAAKVVAKKLDMTRSRAYKLILDHQGRLEGDTDRVSDATKLKFTCKGHPMVRSSHPKTLEFKAGHDLSAKETCVLGVSARFDGLDLSRLGPKIRVSIEVEGMVVSFTALRNPRFASRESMVFRRSRFNCKRTLGVESTLTSAEVDRRIVEAMQKPDTVMEITLEAWSQDPVT